MIDFNALNADTSYRKKLLKYLSDDNNLDKFSEILQKSISKDKMWEHGVDCEIYCHKLYNMTTKKLIGLKFEAFWENNKNDENHICFIISIHPNGMRQDPTYGNLIDSILKIFIRDMRIDEILED